MRPLPRPRIALVFVAVMVALWIAHDPPDPTTSRALKDAEGRLRAFYRETPLPAGWRVETIEVHGTEVWVDLALPAAEAAAFARGPAGALPRALGKRCPPSGDLAWRLLRPSHEIQVRGLAPDGRAEAAVSCRAVNQQAGAGGRPAN